MDRIRIEAIDVYAYHGVHPAERELGQRFVIDVDLYDDFTAAATDDSLKAALDYTAVHRRIREVTANTSFQLIETLCLRICAVLLRDFELAKVGVTVHKPNPPIPNFLGRVSVNFTRDRDDLPGLEAMLDNASAED